MLVIDATLMASLANAGNFSVTPLDVQFSQQQRSAVLTVANDDNKPLTLRVRAMRWTQDATGNDQYQESSDLIFFPRRLNLNPADKRIIRVGVNATGAEESAYRLFIDEVPQVQAGGAQSKLAVLVSFGIPIFITPAEAKGELTIKLASVAEDGQLVLQVANSGGSRVRISRLVNERGDLLSESLTSRYVFPGIAKEYHIAPQQPICGQAPTNLRLETDRGTSEVAVTPAQRC